MEQLLGSLLGEHANQATFWIEKVVRTVAVYFSLIVLLRVAGRRELAQMNTFDLVGLLMLANAVQNAIIGDDNSLAGGLGGGLTLMLLSRAMDWYMYHHPRLEHRVQGTPTRLVRDGHSLMDNLKRELITEAELRSAIHRQGVRRISDCAEVTLEASGTITVLEREPSSRDLATRDIQERLERIERLLVERQAGPQGEASRG